MQSWHWHFLKTLQHPCGKIMIEGVACETNNYYGCNLMTLSTLSSTVASAHANRVINYTHADMLNRKYTTSKPYSAIRRINVSVFHSISFCVINLFCTLIFMVAAIYSWANYNLRWLCKLWSYTWSVVHVHFLWSILI